MLKVEIVTGLMRDKNKDSIDDKINAAIEALECKGLRVRDVRLFPVPYDKNISAGAFIGYAMIYYDDSVCYAENPREFDDAYHRREDLERPSAVQSFR